MPLRERMPRRVHRVDEEAAGPPVFEQDTYVPPRRPPVPEIWPWLLLLLLLVIGGLLAAYFLTRDNNHHQRQDHNTVPLAGPPARVPDVVGSTRSAAVARLEAAGLKAQVTMVPGKAPAGTVVSESPAAGSKVARGSTVLVNASKGQATVPDVRGQPAADADGVLRTAGLVPVEFQVPGTEPKGTVTAQKPLPNKKVPRGSKVRINVSSGSAGASGSPKTSTTSASQTVTAPNIVGIQQSAAQRRLNDEGLRAQVKYVPSSRPVGVVTGQNPGGGTKVKKGTGVILAVSRGPNPTLTIVPNVIGKDQRAAMTTLQNAGFKVQVLSVKPTSSGQSGKVVDEQPAGGTRAPDGSTVTIYVGSG